MGALWQGREAREAREARKERNKKRLALRQAEGGHNN